MVAGDGDRLASLEAALAGSKAWICDVTDEICLHQVMDEVETSSVPRVLWCITQSEIF